MHHAQSGLKLQLSCFLLRLMLHARHIAASYRPVNGLRLCLVRQVLQTSETTSLSRTHGNKFPIRIYGTVSRHPMKPAQAAVLQLHPRHHSYTSLHTSRRNTVRLAPSFS